MSFDDIADRADHYRDVTRENFTASNGVVIAEPEPGSFYFPGDESGPERARALAEYFTTQRDFSIFNNEPEES